MFAFIAAFKQKWHDRDIEQAIHTSIVNFGPQHPAAHGVLRLLLHVDGEVKKFSVVLQKSTVGAFSFLIIIKTLTVLVELDIMH